MKRKVLALLLALTLCTGLAIPAMAAETGDTTITSEYGVKYTLSKGIVGTETRTFGDVTETVYIISEGTIITLPNNYTDYDSYFYNPPYTDRTGPVGIGTRITFNVQSGDFMSDMYKRYQEMFNAMTKDFPNRELADISSCILHFLNEEVSGSWVSEDGSGGGVSLNVIDSIAFRVVSATPTPDAPSSWAVEQVNAAIAAGIVPEALQSKYTTATTRAEFCALAVALYETATGKTITERKTFDDTKDVNVEKAAAIGVVSGVGDNKFLPDTKLTREQAATMLSRLADAIGKPLTAQAPTFADNASVSSWAFDAVGQMQATGIMGGVGNNTFSPATDYTREQSIITIMRLFEIVK